MSNIGSIVAGWCYLSVFLVRTKSAGTWCVSKQCSGGKTFANSHQDHRVTRCNCEPGVTLGSPMNPSGWHVGHEQQLFSIQFYAGCIEASPPMFLNHTRQWLCWLLVFMSISIRLNDGWLLLKPSWLTLIIVVYYGFLHVFTMVFMVNQFIIA